MLVLDLDAAPARLAPGHTLAAGTRLRDYEITGLIGEGGFGIVYLAWDHSLQRKVAIKEYMPASIASRVGGSSAIVVKSERHLDTFKAGLKSFVNEARLLARFDHPSLVKVYRFWEENGTAYMVMPFYEGPTLKTALAELGHVPSEGELRTWLRPVLNAITVLHDGGVWHCNIGPGEIMLTPVGPVLLGFASARQAIAAALLRPEAGLQSGFAAIEQYGGMGATPSGPSTDLYALAAVIYAAITGADPVPAPERLAADHALPLGLVAAGLYSEGFLLAIDTALAVQAARRPRSHAEFRALMGDIDAPDLPASLAPRRDLMQEPFLGRAASDREITVPDRPIPSPPDVPVPVLAPADAKPRPAPAGTQGDNAPPTGSARTRPSWAEDGGMSGNMGKRALYGLVAVTCAFIGIAALALQYYGRQAPRGSGAVAAAMVSAAASAASIAAPESTTPRAAAPAALVAPPAASATTPASAVGLSATPPERPARCIEILQKASLERISAADTEFFKSECK
jgi:serine/threonine protein kinase